MKKLIVIASACTLLLTVGCQSDLTTPMATSYSTEIHVVDNGEGEEFGQELFPWDVDNYWQYFSAETFIIHQVTDKKETINRRTADIYQRLGNGPVAEAYMRVDGEAVWDYGTQFRIWPCSIPRLHFPVRVGKKWKIGDADADLRVQATVEGIEEVATAMGVYRSVRVHYVLSNAADENVRHQRMWFAPGIGIIRWQIGFDTAAVFWGPEESADYLLRNFEITGYEDVRAENRVR